MNNINSKSEINFNWFCINTWKQSCKNTLWCLLGCCIGDFGTILFFQIYNFNLSNLTIMVLAIINGIITSVILETIILLKSMKLKDSFYTALGMSFISMISMEISMNIIDLVIVGKAALTFQVIPLMLIGGFLTPLPYNYWRLKKYNISCH